MWIDDQVLEYCHEPLKIFSYVPPENTVVLGRSNKPELETNESVCQQDGVPILKRYGGGGTVLLHDGCVVVSIGGWVKNPYNNDRYFHLLNQSIINSLAPHYDQAPFAQRGYSDIVLNQRKFVGTSLFRSRTYFLYQASILVDLHLEDIEKYLCHPSKEPDYRKGRSHRDFLMGLGELNPSLDSDTVAKILREALPQELDTLLKEELDAPNLKHVPYLLKRLESNR